MEDYKMEESKVKKVKSAEVAANWWANAIDGKAKQDAKLDNPMAEMLMILSSIKNAVPKVKRDEFQMKLEQRLVEELEKTKYVNLNVDYGAEGILYQVATECGINCGLGSAFPVKTSMEITQDSVKVSNGYGAPEKTIYKEEESSIQ